MVQKFAPNYSQAEKLRFKIEPVNQEQFIVDTNINFNRLNEIYHKIVPVTHSSLTEAYFISLLQGAYETTYFAGALKSEVAVDSIESEIQANVIESVVHRFKNSKSQIENFVDLTLESSNTIREAVNSGAVPFNSVVKLLDSADKFRDWLQKQPIDANLLKAYYQETVKASWVEKLPTKSVRWSIFTGVGLGLDMLGTGGVGTVAGMAASAVDTFLLDKLIGGWKPHQFVEGDLKSLFGTDQNKNT